MAEEISRKSVIYEIGYDFSKGNKEAQTADQNLKKIDKDADKLTNTFKQANGAFKTAFETDKAIKFGQELLQVSARATTLQGRLRAMRNELAGLDEGSARFQKLAIEAAKLEDKIGDVNQRVRNLASDTKNLDAFVSIATGIAGGFAVAQGAVALFGDENEELQKTLLKVQASIAILNGLQQVSATIQNESAAKTFIVTNAQKAYAFAVGASTAATRLFNTVLLLGVGGLALGALALIVTYWQDIAKFIGIAADNQKELNKAQSDYRKKLDESNKVLNENDRVRRETAEGGINDIKRTIAFLEAEGNQEGKVFDLKQLLRRKELDELKIQLSEIEKLRGISIGEQLKQINILADVIKDKENEIKIATINRIKEVVVNLNTLNKAMLENIGITQISQKSIESQTQARKGDTKSIEETIAALGELAKAQTGKSVPKSTVIADERKKNAQLAVDIVNIAEQGSQLLNNVIDADNAAYQRDVDNLRSAFDAKKQILFDEQAALERSKQAGLISQEQFTSRNSTLLKQQAADEAVFIRESNKLKAEKAKDDARFASVQIGINSALAISSATAKAFQDPSNINIAAAAIQVVLALATIATSIAQARSAISGAGSFEEGTEYLQRGKNKPGKDTILLYGNEGEAIIPTEKNADEPGLAKAWINGDLDRYIYRNYVMPEMLKATGKGRADKDYSEKFYKQYLATQDQTVTLNKTLRSIDSKLNGGADYRSRYGRA